MKTISTSVAIVGAGPAGAMLAYLLARKGVEVTLIEAQKDFDRDFRGDTLHPTTLETLDSLGLIEELNQMPHTLMREPILHTPQGIIRPAHMNVVPSKFQYIMLMPQQDFLSFMTKKAKDFKSFRLLMNTKADKLILEKDIVKGLVCSSGTHEWTIKADLIIGADGRFSTIRRLLGKDFEHKDVPADILWFKIPKSASDETTGIGAFISNGHALVELERHNHWQVGFMIEKGSFPKLKKQGIEHFQKEIIKLDPSLKKKVTVLKDWDQIGFLPIECGQVEQWYEDGVLLIGDAAHVMSPVGGVGINYAIQDAVVAANVLTQPLLRGTFDTSHLATIQAKRKWPTKTILWFQNFAHQRILTTIIDRKRQPSVPFFLKWQWVRNLLIRFLTIGLWRVRIDQDSS